MARQDETSSIDAYASAHRQAEDLTVPERVRALLRRMPEGGTVLDVGCRDGMLLRAMAGTLEAKHAELRGVDLSSVRVERARSRGAFGVAVDSAASQVIEHVDDAKMATAVARVLRPGGRAYLTTVFKRTWARYFYRGPGGWALDPTHLREYEAKAPLFALFEGRGLEVEGDALEPLAYPLVDPILKRLGAFGASLGTRTLRAITRARSLRLPIPGYFNWEIFVRRPS
jgi:SAM-dependent methyltransferase